MVYSVPKNPNCIVHAFIYSFDKRRHMENYLLNTSPRGFWGSGWILLSSITPWEDVVSMGTCDGSSVVTRGVVFGGSVGLTVVGWGVVGGGGFITGVVTGFVTGTYLMVGFGVSRGVVLGAGWVGTGVGRVVGTGVRRAVGTGVGRAVGTGVGRAVGLVIGFSVTKAGTYSGLRSCAFSINSLTHSTTASLRESAIGLEYVIWTRWFNHNNRNNCKENQNGTKMDISASHSRNLIYFIMTQRDLDGIIFLSLKVSIR